MIYNKQQCPVCGRKPDAGACTYEHHKMLLRFCSLQCRENFQAHPLLYSSLHAKTQNEIIKRRKLRLSSTLDIERAESLNAALQTIIGVKKTKVQGAGIVIHYDLFLLNLRQLERWLAANGTPLANSWWQRVRRGWIQNTEVTELDNLAMPEGACCSRPPPGAA